MSWIHLIFSLDIDFLGVVGFTLLVVPVAYTLLDDLRTIVVAALFRRMGRDRKAVPVPVVDPEGRNG